MEIWWPIQYFCSEKHLILFINEYLDNQNRKNLLIIPVNRDNIINMLGYLYLYIFIYICISNWFLVAGLGILIYRHGVHANE